MQLPIIYLFKTRRVATKSKNFKLAVDFLLTVIFCLVGNLFTQIPQNLNSESWGFLMR